MMNRKQSGLSIPSFLGVLIVVGIIFYFLARVFPMYQQYFAVRTSLNQLAAESASASATPEYLRDMFQRKMYIEARSNTLRPENVHLTRLSNGWRMQVKFETRNMLIANLDLVAKFNVTQDLTTGSGGGR